MAVPPDDGERFARARALFEEAHADDPKKTDDASRTPFAIVYHRALARWVLRLDPDAGEAIKLASLCQHLRRHLVPREDFPMDTLGYKRWRSTLAQRHVAEARTILLAVGYDDATVDRVSDFLLKRGLRKDSEVAHFEDAICLTFLEVELTSFATKHPEEKLVDILQKTWLKMTPRGQAEALALGSSLPEPLRSVVVRAVASS